MAGISTSMDQLVGLLEDTKEVKISDAAKALGTDKEHIESWANILEREEVIQTHYSVIGGALLRRGKNYDSVMKKGSAPEPAKQVKAPPKETIPEKKIVEITKGPPPSQKYQLIRKKIEEEEDIIERNLKVLKQEQAKVVEYTNDLITEGDKLSAYMESLRKLVDETGAAAKKKSQAPVAEKKHESVKK